MQQWQAVQCLLIEFHLVYISFAGVATLIRKKSSKPLFRKTVCHVENSSTQLVQSDLTCAVSILCAHIAQKHMSYWSMRTGKQQWQVWKIVALELQYVWCDDTSFLFSCLLLPWIFLEHASGSMKMVKCINPTALRTAKTLWSFGCSECNRVK